MLRSDDPDIQISDITPGIGTEIRGLQLSRLSNVQKDELALLLAQREVIIFRDQDFKDIGFERQEVFGSYFGPLHIHVSISDKLHNIFGE